MAKSPTKIPLKKLAGKVSVKSKPSANLDAHANRTQEVEAYLKALKHPLKEEIKAVRAIIKNADTKLSERIKWAAPSFFYKADLVTFNHRNEKAVQLVFHHAAIVKIKSSLLTGDYKDRRLAAFKNMAEVKANKKELERIIKEYVKLSVK